MKIAGCALRRARRSEKIGEWASGRAAAQGAGFPRQRAGLAGLHQCLRSDSAVADSGANRWPARDPAIRARAADALGHDAYMPKEWDGHWWGTQPVKNPLPPNSVAWSGTAPAIAALSGALADSDATVRLAAAQALSLGTGPGSAARLARPACRRDRCRRAPATHRDSRRAARSRSAECLHQDRAR